MNIYNSKKSIISIILAALPLAGFAQTLAPLQYKYACPTQWQAVPHEPVYSAIDATVANKVQPCPITGDHCISDSSAKNPQFLRAYLDAGIFSCLYKYGNKGVGNAGMPNIINPSSCKFSDGSSAADRHPCTTSPEACAITCHK